MKGQEFLPYGHQTIEEEDLRAVEEALRAEWLTQGPAVARFEAALAERCGARNAVAVSSGTAALHLAAIVSGIRPGDLVATSPITFLATANCIVLAGGDPAFVDVDPSTVNIDPARLEELLDSEAGSRVKGVIPVHFAGCPADMARIGAIARARGLFVIEDASHALGAARRDEAGTWREIGKPMASGLVTFSFHPVKHVTTGEGGAVLTDDDDVAARLRRLRTGGMERNVEGAPGWFYEMHEPGFNYRITDFQCALGLAQLSRLETWVYRRAALVDRYRELLRGVEGVAFVTEPAWARPAWHLFTVRVPRRDYVYEALRAQGIGVQVHYIPVHLQPFYRERLGTKEGDFPEAEAYYAGALSLPLFPSMKEADVDRVASALSAAVQDSA